MRAALITELTGPDGITIAEVPEPVAGPGQVLLDVHAAGVVFPDALRTHGAYQVRPELPFIPGWEVSGIVREPAAGFAAGERVVAIPGVGGMAEVVAVDAEWVFALPESVPLDRGAAVPLNYLTMHFALHRRAQLRAGEAVLVHGAAGGVGTAACQLAAAAGADVIAVTSTPEKAAVARAAGAREAVPVEGFLAAVRELTGGRGVDVIVDPVGGHRFTDSLRCLAPEGRVVVLGFTGRQIPTVAVNRLLLRNIAVVGAGAMEFWRHHPGYVAEQWRELVPLIRSGVIDPPLGSRYPLERAADAIRELDERRAVGRVLVEVRPEAS